MWQGIVAWFGPVLHGVVRSGWVGRGKVRLSSTVWSGVDRRGGVGPGMVWQGNGCITLMRVKSITHKEVHYASKTLH